MKIFLFFILTFFLIHSVNSQKSVPQIVNGVIDLENWDLKNDGSIKISGNWLFYKNVFLQSPSQADTMPYFHIQVPGIWSKIAQMDNTGYGTYRLKLIIHQNKQYRLSFRIRLIGVAFTALVNGKEMYYSGKVSNSKEGEIPFFNPGILEFNSEHDTVDLMIRVSNFHHYRGGIWRHIWFGEEDQIRKEKSITDFYDWFLIGCLLIMGFYHVSLYLIRRTEVSNLFFGLLTLLFVFRIGVNDNMFFSIILELPWNAIIFTEYFTFYCLPFMVILFMNEIFSDKLLKKLVYISAVVAIVFLIPVFVSQPIFYSRFPIYYRVYVFLLCVILIPILVKMVYKKKEGASIFLIGFSIFAFFTIIDLLSHSYVIYTRQYAPFGVLIFNFSQSFILNLRFAKSFKKVEEMANQLDFQNKNLELMVDERTREIEMQKEDIAIKVRTLRVAFEEINAQHKIVLDQKEAIELYNKNINAALRYAFNIQKSMLPSDENLKDVLGDYFLIYKPKDIVSGDFYWASQKNKIKYIAIADCTGHGVPGAFMSILGITILTETINRFASINPSEMLHWLQTGLKNLIKNQEYAGVTPKEGMDIIFCVLDTKNMQLYYAGARMNIILVRNSQIVELPIERLPMGITNTTKNYNTKSVKIEKNDMVYIYTDGFTDQFGGVFDKKYLTKRLYSNILEVHTNTTNIQKTTLEKAISLWMKDPSNQTDDITILGIRI